MRSELGAIAGMAFMPRFLLRIAVATAFLAAGVMGTA